MRRGARARLAWALALAAVLAAMAAAAFAPFERFPANGAARAPDASALRFDGAGIAWLRAPLPEPDAAPDAPRELTIALRIRADDAPNDRPGTVFAIDDATLPWRLRLAQRGDAALLDWREPRGAGGERDPAGALAAGGGERIRHLGASGLLAPGRAHDVAVVTGARGTRVAVDGVVVPDLDSRSPALHTRAAGDAHAARVALGNDPSARSGWRGEVLGWAAFPRALAPDELARVAAALRGDGGAADALADAWSAGRFAHGAPAPRGVALPATIAGAHRPALAAGRAPPRRDALLNFAGFAPLGALLAAAPFGRRRALARFALALAACCALSLAIELAQVDFPARFSSLYDWWLNTAGGGLGALVGAALAARRSPATA